MMRMIKFKLKTFPSLHDAQHEFYCIFKVFNVNVRFATSRLIEEIHKYVHTYLPSHNLCRSFMLLPD